ncbi:MAG TPA: hypothetical protein VNM34_15270 [Verrucomicrobiae bacterium]|nr:hypothetical protein [Verrucomicrobiae bacterium]
MDRLAHQVVAELHDLVVAGEQEVALGSLSERCGDLGRLHPGHGREDVVACGQTCHGNHAQQISGRRGEGTDPGQQRLPEGETDALLAPLRDGEELLGEEGIAATAVVEARHERAIRWMAQDARQLIVYLDPGERGELEALDLSAPPQLGEQGQERMAFIELVGAIRPDHHHPSLGEVAYQEAEQVAGRPIGPVKVLQRDDGDGIGGDSLDQPEHLEVEPGLRRQLEGGGRRIAGSVRLEVGNELQDRGSRGPDDAVEFGRRQ